MPRLKDLGVGVSAAAVAVAVGVAAVIGVVGGVGVGEAGDSGWGSVTQGLSLDKIKGGRKLRRIVTICIYHHDIIRLCFNLFALVRLRWLE